MLFAEGASPGALRSVVEALLSRGFLPSAKHEFQLIRVLRVAGTDVAFNVDLLHPLELVGGEKSLTPDMFVDHIDLTFRLSECLPENYSTKSIATPHAGFILEDRHLVTLRLEFDLPDESSSTIEIPIMDEVGLIITKSQSVGSAKRMRDAFDLYLAIAQARSYGDVVESFRSMKSKRPNIFNALCSIRNTIAAPEFGRRVETFVPVELRDSSLHAHPPVDRYSDVVVRFLRDVGLDDQADDNDARRSDAPQRSF